MDDIQPLARASSKTEKNVFSSSLRIPSEPILSQSAPRLVFLEHLFDRHSMDEAAKMMNATATSLTRKRYLLEVIPTTKPSSSSSHPKVDIPQQTECDFIQDWQRQSLARPTCNQLHELGIRLLQSSSQEDDYYSSILPGSKGSRKQVWSIGTKRSSNNRVLFKTNLLVNEYDGADEKYGDIKDALIMDQTTSSPYIMNLYGWCMQSSLVERADGTLHHWLKNHLRRNTDSTSHVLLQVAIMLSKAVVDMQVRREDMDLPTVMNGDIKPAQFLYLVDRHKDQQNDAGSLSLNQTSIGVHFKLNDFNMAHLLTKHRRTNTENTTNSSICSYPEKTGFHMRTGRAPEEYDKGSPLTDKIDVAALGSLFYVLLTGLAPYTYDFHVSGSTNITKNGGRGRKIPRAEAKKMIRRGLPPPLPTSLTESTDFYIQTLVKAMLECKRLKPQNRPNPSQIVTLLEKALTQGRTKTSNKVR